MRDKNHNTRPEILDEMDDNIRKCNLLDLPEIVGWGLNHEEYETAIKFLGVPEYQGRKLEEE
jgi:hypothetical protein